MNALTENAHIDVSVVVPSYGHSSQLRRLLESFDRLEPGPAFEVIVVDDCSPDDTEQVVKAWMDLDRSFPTRYHRLDHNQGPAVARNEGTRLARGKWVAYTDSDCVVHPAWLRTLPRRLMADSTLAAVAGHVLPLHPEGLYSQYNTVNNTLVPDEGVTYLITANACYVRDLVLQVGGFDAEVRKPGGEDVALSIKLGLAGYCFAYDPEAIVYHDYQETFRHFVKTWKNYAFGNGYVIAKICGGLDAGPWNRNSLRPPSLSLRWTRHVLGVQRAKCRANNMTRFQILRFLALRYVQMVVHAWYFVAGEDAYYHEGNAWTRCRKMIKGSWR